MEGDAEAEAAPADAPLDAEHSLAEPPGEAGEASEAVDDATTENVHAAEARAPLLHTGSDETVPRDVFLTQDVGPQALDAEGGEEPQSAPAGESAEAQEAAPADGEPQQEGAGVEGAEAAAEVAAEAPAEMEDAPQEAEPEPEDVGGEERLNSAEAAGPIEPEPELSPLESCAHLHELP